MGFYFNITFVKKYLYGFTSQEEEEDLLENPEINGKLAEVWDNFQDIKSKANTPDTEKIFTSIKELANIPEKPIYCIESPYKAIWVPWYRKSISIAASAIIFVVLSFAGFYIYNRYYANPLIEVISEKGQRKEFTLPDGTRVWLNADTRLTYHKRFDDKSREVSLWGEAYFSVVKNASRPFIVKTSKLSITVLGTVFNVKSYPGDKTIETTLVTGLVSIQKNRNNKSLQEAPILVKPKQKAVFSVSEEQMEVENVNIDKSTSWKNGKLVFDNESVDAVVAKLQRWYGVKVEVIGSNRLSDFFTLTVKDENIEEVIHLLQLTSPITLKVEDLDGSNKRIYEFKSTNYDLKQ